MNLTDDFKLKDLLQGFGLKSLFDKDLCDLSLILTTKRLSKNKEVDLIPSVVRLDYLRRFSNLENSGLYVTNMIHKVFLGFDEMGTEGAAVTATPSLNSISQVQFIVNAPFMFIIRHDPTKIPLFYGLVFDPSN
jgi:hypothetical protein